VVDPLVVDAGEVLGVVVAATAVVAVVAVGAAVVVAAALPLLSLPHAAATNPKDTSSAVGASHRCLVTQIPQCSSTRT